MVEAPFYLHALGFDSEPGKLGAELISSFNKLAQEDKELSKVRIGSFGCHQFP